jgi:hypothetical protein
VLVRAYGCAYGIGDMIGDGFSQALNVLVVSICLKTFAKFSTPEECHVYSTDASTDRALQRSAMSARLEPNLP